VIPYEEFVQRVRRYRPSDLLPALAETAIRFFEKERWDAIHSPWALAEAAKVSIVAGNEFRSEVVTARVILEICHAYNKLDDPLRTREPGVVGTAEAYFTRVETLQFPYQMSVFEEVSRIGALFETVDNLDTKMLNSSALSDILGCSLNDYVTAGFAISTMARARSGYFDVDWPEIWGGSNSLGDLMNRETLDGIFRRHYLSSLADFRGLAAGARQGNPKLHQLRVQPFTGASIRHLEERRERSAATSSRVPANGPGGGLLRRSEES
jgi:hypothetical protein